MYISRIVVRNFRNLEHLDVALGPGVTYVAGENNTGKSNLLRAIRLAADAGLSSTFRALIEHDIHSEVDLSRPEQVVISLEFSDYLDSEGETALVGLWEVEEGRARLTYRFRPRATIRDAIEAGDHDGTGLAIEDYHWELTGGGDLDPATVEWDEDVGSSVRFGDLQSFHLAFLPALRDVEQDLRRSRVSPLARMFSATGITEDEKRQLVEVLRQANAELERQAPVGRTEQAIQSAFADLAGTAFDMDIRVGMSDPSFPSIARSLTLLISDDSLDDFDPSRNGLGFNNLLYVAMLLDLFNRRIEADETAGQLLLVEEPEAHLHPQLQRVLHEALAHQRFQTILTTHSTHVSSLASMGSFLVLSKTGQPGVSSSTPATDADLTEQERGDLERFLDATRSTLLFARRVMLVEGPSEAFLIPAMVESILGISLDRVGVSVIPIHGTHFEVYSKLFGPGRIEKKCAIVADGDLKPSDSVLAEDTEPDDVPAAHDLGVLENEYVGVFQCRTTFERAITTKSNLPMLSEVARELGATTTAGALTVGYERLVSGELDKDEYRDLLQDLRRRVLNTARGKGKARFAQIASRHAQGAGAVPRYVREALDWLLED